MNFARVIFFAISVFLAGCVAAPKWQTDSSPDSEVAVINRSLDPFANLLNVNGEGKGWGFVHQVRLPPGKHVIGFAPNPLYWKLIPTDPKEPRDGYLTHYIKFVGEKGVIYDVRTTHVPNVAPASGSTGSFRIEIVERSTGRVASTLIGNFHKRPVLQD